jgi:hypothetical protein
MDFLLEKMQCMLPLMDMNGFCQEQYPFPRGGLEDECPFA